jgi:hypothetical protein
MSNALTPHAAARSSRRPNLKRHPEASDSATMAARTDNGIATTSMMSRGTLENNDIPTGSPAVPPKSQ